MEFKGTKGNWEVVKDSDSVWIESALWSIADVNKVGTLQEYNANAKLIAAAPDLLEELITLLSNIDEMGNTGEDMRELRTYLSDARKVINKVLN